MTLGIGPRTCRWPRRPTPTEPGFEVVVEVVEKLGSKILLTSGRIGHDGRLVEPNVRAKIHDRLRRAQP